MSSVLKISEAASIALHSMVFLRENRERAFSTREIAEALQVSGNHLSKVFQRLSRARLVNSIRGPRGGFTLGRDPSEINLLEIYEAIEGPLTPTDCLLKNPMCKKEGCVFGDLLEKVNREVTDYMAETKLSSFVDHLFVNDREEGRGTSRHNPTNPVS